MSVQYRPISAAVHTRSSIGEPDVVVWSSVVFEVWRNHKPYYSTSCTFSEDGQFDQLGWQGDDPLPECPQFVIDQMKFVREIFSKITTALAENSKELQDNQEYVEYKEYRIMRKSRGH